MNHKLSIVVLLLVCSITTKAQDFSGLELFKAKPVSEQTSPDWEDLLKVEYKTEGKSTYDTKFIGERKYYRESPRIDKYYPRRGTRNFVNLYIGLNNYFEDGKLPGSQKLYSLNPLNSWYGGLSFDNVTRLFGSIYLDWGFGGSVQEYAFENTRTRLLYLDDGIVFFEDDEVKGKKSKMKLWYLNAHLVPTLAVGRHDAFRVGLGVFGSYKLSSSVIYKYDDAFGNKQKEKNKGGWHVPQFKYGIRGIIGWSFFDIFVNYEMTQLFAENVDAPRLNPITFGLIF